jgi:hypothetical protein
MTVSQGINWVQHVVADQTQLMCGATLKHACPDDLTCVRYARCTVTVAADGSSPAGSWLASNSMLQAMFAQLRRRAAAAACRCASRKTEDTQCATLGRMHTYATQLTLQLSSSRWLR